MQNRLFKIAASVATIGAMALGGAALANAASPGLADQHQAITATAPVAEQEAAVDTDAVEFESQSEADDATEVGGVDTDATEVGAAEAPESAGSETASDSDGPGGHADEPGNANADHQFDGEE